MTKPQRVIYSGEETTVQALRVGPFWVHQGLYGQSSLFMVTVDTKTSGLVILSKQASHERAVAVAKQLAKECPTFVRALPKIRRDFQLFNNESAWRHVSKRTKEAVRRRCAV